MRKSFSSQDACLPSRERGCKSLLPHQKSQNSRLIAFVVQWFTTPACHAGDEGSIPSDCTKWFGSSRWLERLSCKQENVSSIPTQTLCSGRETVHSLAREARAYGFESRLEYHALIEELAVSPGLEPGVCGFDSRSAHHNLGVSRGLAFLTQLVEVIVSNTVL